MTCHSVSRWGTEGASGRTPGLCSRPEAGGWTIGGLFIQALCVMLAVGWNLGWHGQLGHIQLVSVYVERASSHGSGCSSGRVRVRTRENERERVRMWENQGNCTILKTFFFTSWFYFIFLNFYLLIFRESKERRKKRKRNTNLLFPLFMHSLLASWVCPDLERTCNLGISGQSSN